MHPDERARENEGTPASPRRRARVGWITAGAALAAAGVAAVVWAHAWHRPALQGAVVTPPAPTYDFSLRDQDRRLVRLSALRGKAVALTFLYTHCPDICPLIAAKMHETYRQLGDAVAHVAFVAVSVDPTGDTPEAVRAFLSGHHVTGELTYLTGSFAELKPIWAGFFIGTDARAANPEAGAAAPPSPGVVSHSAIVYVLDPRGDLRVFLPGNFDPRDLATDLRILAQEPGR
ncbi:MAG: SCO family protein [Bacillati bacterium ANGP1]|uniref:SCO family protein n=1 Tax=Candidatus Segetimicrobium genomatis TaxID=2569760 RepID=A0A537M969_9BACT|nr:MAG: SCO family protein [Terrabacteria group bacterium ANGP1]